MILGTGLDLVEVARIADLAKRHGERFLKRVFTDAELAYCLPRAARDVHLAGRFAAKEAVFKALGTGWSEKVSWKQIEILPGASGAPEATLTRGARAHFESMGGKRLLISITHTASLAAASAVIEG